MVPISSSCVHWQGEIECPSPECYRRLPCDGLDEAWGLGKYSSVKRRASDSGFAYFGDIINQLKYTVAPSQEYWSDRAEHLAKQVSLFLNKRVNRVFDSVLVIPGNRPNSKARILPFKRCSQAPDIPSLRYIRVSRSLEAILAGGVFT